MHAAQHRREVHQHGHRRSVKAQFEYAMADLKVRLPRLVAATKKAQLVFDAGAELTADGADAIGASLSAFADSDVETSVKARIATCAPRELKASGKAIGQASGEVSAQVKAANDVAAAVGM